MDIGESLVGSYYRQIRRCHTIAFNQFLPNAQGEIDVIALADTDAGPEVWLAEVAIHLQGLNYNGYQQTAMKIASKFEAAAKYAREVFPTRAIHLELWSPVVPIGLVELIRGSEFEFVVNEAFTERVNVLAGAAGASTKMYGDDAFRLLQLLTHLRGERPVFAKPRAQ